MQGTSHSPRALPPRTLRVRKCQKGQSSFSLHLPHSQAQTLREAAVAIHCTLHPRSFLREPASVRDRLVSHYRTTSASTAPYRYKGMCCPTHCSSYCAPCHQFERERTRALPGKLHSPHALPPRALFPPRSRAVQCGCRCRVKCAPITDQNQHGHNTM